MAAGAGVRPAWRHGARSLAVVALHGLAFIAAWPLVRAGRGAPAAYGFAGRRLAALCEALGPTYVKLGQILSVRPDLLPAEMVASLRSLQDQVAPVSFAAIDRVLRRAYGEDYRARLTVDPRPVAAGAIAQVHRATDADGRVLALKVRRPDVASLLCADLALVNAVAGWASRRRALRALPVRELAGEITALLAEQLDFRREADNNRRFRANFARAEGVRLPALADELCNDEVIAMEFMADLLRVDDPRCRQAARQRAALEGLRALYKMIFDDGFVHADLHAGNFFLSHHGGVILLDTGLVADVPEATRRDFVDFFFAVANDDAQTCADLTWRIALARPCDRMTAEFAADMRAFVGRFSRLRSGEFEVTRFVYELLELQRRHKLRSSPAFVTIVLAMVVYDGLCKTLHPELDFQAEARGYLISARYSRGGRRSGYLKV